MVESCELSSSYKLVFKLDNMTIVLQNAILHNDSRLGAHALSSPTRNTSVRAGFFTPFKTS